MQSDGAGQATPRWWAVERALRSRSPLLWFAVAAAIIGYCGMPLSDHPDTLRDLLAARDCIERGDCAAEGATTSFGNLHNGALWPFLLAMLRAAHLPTPTIWWLVLVSDALTVALVFVGVDHAAHKGLPPRQVTAHSSHLAALAALTLLVVERTPNTVWSPALAPWLAALVVAWWLRWRVDPPAAPWGPLVFGVLLALLVDSHPANWPCAAAWLAALVVVESRPVAALAWSGAGLAAATALLAPATQWRNLAVVAAGIHDPLLVLLGGTLVAAAGRALPHSWRHQPAFAPLAAAFGAGAILIGGTVAFGRDLEVRYLTPALLTGCAALAALPWPTLACRLPIAGLAVGSALLAAVRLGPGNISAGHSWPVVQQVAAALDGAGIRYPASAARIQGYGCQRLAAAAEVEATTGPWMATAPRPDGVQVLDLPSHLPAPAGWWLLERRPASSTYWRTQRFWLDTGAGRACLLRGASSTCVQIQPGLGLAPDGARAVRPGAPWHTRAMPESVALPAAASEDATILVDIPVRSEAGSSRVVALLDSAGAACPWTVARTDHPGAHIAQDRLSVVLPGASTATTLTVAKTFNGRCSPLAAWGANPPCVLELAPPLPPLAVP